MFKHYFKTGYRNLLNQKGLAVINIFGLSVGIACFSLFILYALNEFGFDAFHKNGKDIYRVYIAGDLQYGQAVHGSSYLPIPLGPALKDDLPGIEDYVRIKDTHLPSFVRADNKVSRVAISFADPQFFSIFSFKILSGNPVNVFPSINSVVLTKEKANQLFGNVNPIGKTIDIKTEDDFEPFIVSAVTENIPSNSTIQYDILGNFDYFLTTKSGRSGATNWKRSGFQTYVKLQQGTKPATLLASLKTIRTKYYPNEVSELKKSGKGDGKSLYYGLQPITSMHTDTLIGGGGIEPVETKNIWILLAIAFSVLLIACINFTTLTIGRSAGRAKEVGVRKVIGGTRKQLMFQFLAEAFILTLFSGLVGLSLSHFLLPYFNQLSGRQLYFSIYQYPSIIIIILGMMVLVGIMAGYYPALILSGFKPIEVFRNKLRLGGSNIFTRSLVTFQFILSIGLIISNVIIIQQLKFLENKNPGFNKENVVMVDAEGIETRKVFPLFRQSLAQQPGILDVAGSELGLGQGTGWSQEGFEYNGKHKEVYEYYVDDHYLNLMQIPLLAGRNFDPTIASDTVNSVIVNEEMVKDFGWTLSNAVGQELKGYDEKLTPVVIGVVKNFNFRPLSESMKPQMFHQFHNYAPYKYFVRIQPGNPTVALEQMKKTWTSLVPGLPFKYDFLDENLDAFYKAESRWSNIVGWAGGISIFLASLGLFALAALAAINRTKEIGIRKILGASFSSILILLSKDFIRVIALAFVIAAPVAWYCMQTWLQDFAYRITIGWIVFAGTGVAAIALSMLIISFHAGKAAITNPVKSLRTE